MRRDVQSTDQGTAVRLEPVCVDDGSSAVHAFTERACPRSGLDCIQLPIPRECSSDGSYRYYQVRLTSAAKKAVAVAKAVAATVAAAAAAAIAATEASSAAELLRQCSATETVIADATDLVAILSEASTAATAVAISTAAAAATMEAISTAAAAATMAAAAVAAAAVTAAVVSATVATVATTITTAEIPAFKMTGLGELNADLSDPSASAALFAKAGVCVFESALPTSLIDDCRLAFEKTSARVDAALRAHEIGVGGSYSGFEVRFNEVCQRGRERLDIRTAMQDGALGDVRLHNEGAPWMVFVRQVLGEGVHAVLR